MPGLAPLKRNLLTLLIYNDSYAVVGRQVPVGSDEWLEFLWVVWWQARKLPPLALSPAPND